MRTDQFLITASVETSPGRMVKIPGPWDKISGGDVTASETKYRPGGMGPEKSLGGVVSVGNVTVERNYDFDRGDHDLAIQLAPRAGRARAQVTKQPLDTDGVPQGKPMIYTGRLLGVNYPDSDSTSTGAAMWTLTVSTEGSIG